MQKFLGKGQFVWFMGVVEDVNDPLMIGRCRVRCLGLHSEDRNEIPTEDLPWAIPVQPITSAARSGKGWSPTGLVPGSWVVGFFRDGEDCQEPMIMGSIAGIPQEEPDFSKGFSDPRTQEQLAEDPRSGGQLGNGFIVQQYPTNGAGAAIINEPSARKYPQRGYLQEPDTNRLARNENTVDTIVELKKANADRFVPTADITATPKRVGSNGTTSPVLKRQNRAGAWTEPLTPYGAEYPHNHVYESESGHIIEIDDTPQRERLHRYHRSGTFEEIHPNGDRVEKIVRNNYTIVMKNDNVHVEGFKNVTVDKACKILVNADEEGNDLDIQVAKTGNLNLEVTEGNINAKVGTGDVNLQVENGSLNLHVNGNFNQYVRGNYTQIIDGQYIVRAGGGPIYMNASQIHLNKPNAPTSGGETSTSATLPAPIVSDAARVAAQRTQSTPRTIKKEIG